MSRRNIIITDDDRKRLEHLLASDFTEAIRSKSYLRDLRAELQRAKTLDDFLVRHDDRVRLGCAQWSICKGNQQEKREHHTDEGNHSIAALEISLC